jgi:hypothetical protein
MNGKVITYDPSESVIKGNPNSPTENDYKALINIVDN